MLSWNNCFVWGGGEEYFRWHYKRSESFFFLSFFLLVQGLIYTVHRNFIDAK